MRIALSLGLLLSIWLSGCSAPRVPSLADLPGPTDLPFIHKIDIQQGNVVTQEMIARLRRGMDKKKVLFVMGTPIIQDTFHASRWDYIYTFHEGGGDTERRQITLIFVDDVLDRIEGDVTPAEGELVVDLHQDTTVDVPGQRRKGLITRIKNTIPFTGDDEAKSAKSGDDKGGDDDGKDEPPAVAFEATPRISPYADIQAAPGEGIIVPPDAPQHTVKKGFFARLVDSIGLGAEEDIRVRKDDDYDPGTRGYRDVSNPDDQ